MTTVEQITANHGAHTGFTPGCGQCRFGLIYDTRDHYLHTWDVQLRDGDDEGYRDLGHDYARGLDWLRVHGYTETHWNWEHQSYLGGNNVYGRTQKFSTIQTFRNPQTGKWAWLSYKSEEGR